MSSFTKAVKDVMNKELGLQTRQFVQTYATSVIPPSALAADCVYALGLAGDFTANWGIITAGSDEKISLRSMTQKSWFTNNSNSPVIMWYWICECRVNTNRTFSDLLSDGHALYQNAYIDPTTGGAFRRFFHIAERGQKIIQAGQCEMLQISKFWPTGRIVTGDVEGTGPYNRDVTRVLYTKFATIPVDNAAAGASTVLGEICINTVNWKQATYYVHEENDPQTTVVGQVLVADGRVFADVSEQATDAAMD